MRIKNIKKNISHALFFMIVVFIFNFILRTVFVYTLGNEILGLNSLMTNIIGMLSLADLGVSTAIGFSLYKPIAKKEIDVIKSIMFYFKKVYRIIGIVILIFGLLFMPFLHYFIVDFSTIDNIYLIYILFLLATVIGYFYSYKRTLVMSDQKNYLITKYTSIFKIIMYLVQSIILLLFSNFILFLVIQLIVVVVENIIINKMIDKRYSYLKSNEVLKIDDKVKFEIKKNVKAMFFHKVGDYAINGTDNLIMSSFISIASVGIYANYFLITSTVSAFITTIFNNITSSLGNLIVSEDTNNIYNKFVSLNFVGFILANFFAINLLFLLNPFLKLWLGSEFIFSSIIVIVMVVNFYLVIIRLPLSTLKISAGIYNEDKYVPLIQAVVNLVVSIVLVQYIGILGVFIGTLVSSLFIVFWIRPYILYKKVFNKSLGKYFKDIYINIISFIVQICLIYIFTLFLEFDSLLLVLISNLVIVNLVFLIINSLFFYRNKSVSYLISIFRKRKVG